MAKMFPNEFPYNPSPQEDREHVVFEHLKTNLGEEDKVFYDHIIFGKGGKKYKPDFIILSQEHACIVLEVKNWDLSKISPNPDNPLKCNIGDSIRSNPFKQADTYVDAIQHYFTRRGKYTPASMVQQEGKYSGKLTFPITPAVAFLGTTDQELEKVAAVINVDREYLLSEETLKDKEKLQNWLLDIPRVFQGPWKPDAFHEAAKMLLPSIDFLFKKMDGLPQELGKSLEKYKNNREKVAEVCEELAQLIYNQEHEEDPSVEQLAELAEQLRDQQFLVGTFGTSTAGKSTLINTLVDDGQDCLREGMGRTTKIVTRIKQPQKEDGREHGASLLKYKSSEQISGEIKMLLHEMGIPDDEHPQNYNLEDSTTFTKLEEVLRAGKESLGLRGRESFSTLQQYLSGWEEAQAFISKEQLLTSKQKLEADSLTHCPNHSKYLLERILYHENRLTTEHGFQLVDSPGVAANSEDTERARNIAEQADALIFVSKVDFQLMQADQEFLEELCDELGERSKDKIIFVLNQIQRINPYQCGPNIIELEEAIDFQVDRFREQIENFLDSERITILPVDAYCAKLARRMKKSPTDSVIQMFKTAKFPDAEDLDENIKLSGIEKFEEDLVNLLLDGKIRDVDDKIFKTEKILAKRVHYLREKIDDIGLKKEDINNELEDHFENKKDVNRQLKGLLAELKERLDEEIHRENKKEVNLLIDNWIDSTTKKVSRSLSRKTTKSTASIVNETIQDEINDLMKEIRKLRSKCEKEYDRIKDDAISEDVPEIMKKYGMKWDLKPVDIKKSPSNDLQDIINEFKIKKIDTITANCMAFIPDIIRSIKRLKIDQPTYRELIEKKLRTKESSIRNDVSEKISSWIENDYNNFKKQLIAHLKKLLNEIEVTIKLRIKAKTDHEKDAEKYKAKLNQFRATSEDIMNKLNDVHKEVQLRRSKEQ